MIKIRFKDGGTHIFNPNAIACIRIPDGNYEIIIELINSDDGYRVLMEDIANLPEVVTKINRLCVGVIKMELDLSKAKPGDSVLLEDGTVTRIEKVQKDPNDDTFDVWFREMVRADLYDNVEDCDYSFNYYQDGSLYNPDDMNESPNNIIKIGKPGALYF